MSARAVSASCARDDADESQDESATTTRSRCASQRRGGEDASQAAAGARDAAAVSFRTNSPSASTLGEGIVSHRISRGDQHWDSLGHDLSTCTCRPFFWNAERRALEERKNGTREATTPSVYKWKVPFRSNRAVPARLEYETPPCRERDFSGFHGQHRALEALGERPVAHDDSHLFAPPRASCGQRGGLRRVLPERHNRPGTVLERLFELGLEAVQGPRAQPPMNPTQYPDSAFRFLNSELRSLLLSPIKLSRYGEVPTVLATRPASSPEHSPSRTLSMAQTPQSLHPLSNNNNKTPHV